MQVNPNITDDVIHELLRSQEKLPYLMRPTIEAAVVELRRLRNIEHTYCTALRAQQHASFPDYPAPAT